MKQAKSVLVAVAAFGVIAIAPALASAEWFVDLYAGRASTQDADVAVEVLSSVGLGFGTASSATRKVNFDTSLTFGSRVGYWFEALPWMGVAVDASFFRAEGQGVDITVIPLSFLLMLRWPLLTSDDFPHGRIQPYFGIGPGLFISDFEVDFRPTVPTIVSDTSSDTGLDIRAGLAWQFHRRMALFGEYRFTHVSIDFESTDFLFPFIAGTSEKFKTTLDTHHFLAGISFRF